MLRIDNVSKSFGPTRAVDNVSIEMQPGEIVGLVGENGAGKTTLMRIVAGELDPDRGTIDAPAPIGFVHQHFVLVNAFTIAENLALVGATVSAITLPDPSRLVADLSVGEKSKIELAKAIARNPRVLILDEPTSVLTPTEAAELFAVMRQLAASGTIVVFISHKIPEVLAVATRVVVMRGGKIVAEGGTAEEIANAMVLVRGASGEQRAAGGITAIVGVAGNGQAELAARLRREAKGIVAAIPEDRTRDGLIAEMTIAENLALRTNVPAEQLIAEYNIKASGPKQKAGSLSGGNQQKVLLARELSTNPNVIVAAEPTRGLDAEATRFVHDRLRDAAARGAEVFLITSDLDEAFALGDAIQVIYRGRLSERLTPEEAAERAPQLMAGL
ncbi:MAG TPA: ATP-binding cassette domain-containing protein [Thermoanaerobaculia bacterium]|nr:ATP-binding cassette domain-containing protein [Thermoanaerobaculia bacterium]